MAVVLWLSRVLTWETVFPALLNVVSPTSPSLFISPLVAFLEFFLTQIPYLKSELAKYVLLPVQNIANQMAFALYNKNVK